MSKKFFAFWIAMLGYWSLVIVTNLMGISSIPGGTVQDHLWLLFDFPFLGLAIFMLWFYPKKASNQNLALERKQDR